VALKSTVFKASLQLADIDRLEPLESGGKTVVLTRAAPDWLEPGQCFVASAVCFDQLIGSANWTARIESPVSEWNTRHAVLLARWRETVARSGRW
jgi:hypothetical protein